MAYARLPGCNVYGDMHSWSRVETPGASLEFWVCACGETMADEL
jgi:hypothetical protein